MVLEWEEYFMELAKLTAKRSKDPNTQVGAVIVNTSKRVIGLGYNGFIDIPDNDILFPWTKDSDKYEEIKYSYVIHAEANAILNATSAIKNSALYVTLYPCRECAKLIIQSGIKKVVYLNYKEDLASARMFKAAKIETIQFKKGNDNNE